MNEPLPRANSKLCPICSSKIPFSLALHLAAAHSPEAMARNAEAAAEPSPAEEWAGGQSSSHAKPREGHRQNQGRNGQAKFGRKRNRHRR